MYYEFARSEGCNRFSIGNKRTIAITPTAKTQMVLGTNGSGKTSMLSILWSPFPANPKDFDGFGEREVHILHKGHRYEIKDTFGDRNTYSFKRDGEELNRDGKVTPQWKLCEEHFGYTKELHEFFIGDVNFTDLSPQKRRDWIAKMSTMDFDYAFAEYDRFRKGLTKSKNIVEHLQGRINEETSRLITEEDLQQMRDHVRELHDTLNMLMREPRSTQPVMSEAEVHARFENTNKSIERFLKAEYPEIADLTALLQEINEGVNTLKGELNIRAERVDQLEQRHLRIASLLESDPETIQNEINSLREQLQGLGTNKLQVPEEMLLPADSAIVELRRVLIDLPDEYVSQGDVAKILHEAQTKRQLANKIEGAMREITLEIDHIRRCSSVTCPTCATSFKPGVEPGRLEMLQGRAVKGTEHLAKAGGEASEAEDWLERTSAKANLFTELEQIRQSWHHCQGLWMHLDNCGGLQKGKALLHELARYEAGVVRAQQVLTASKRLAELERALEQWKREAGADAQLMEELTVARAEYTSLHARYMTEVNRSKEVEEQLIYEKNWESWRERAVANYEDLLQALRDYTQQAMDNDREELIRKTQTTLAINEEALNTNEVISAIVKDLETQLAKAKVEEEAYKRLVDGICPKTGLIAEKITEQIGSIVGKVNQLLQKVWGYPLYIHMPEAGEADLDYKFPMNVDGVPRDDIAQGSRSIKEIINTAFRVVGYYCMRMVDYPLFLDEPGSSFDEVHNQNLIPLIKDLVDNERFSQIFVISHNIDAQTAFPNSQTIIMDDRNIPNYPHPYNQHVELA